ncbi:hypothetical protein [Sphingomonas sp. CROZ-RG-20F-R02-07]|uniref:hypothetical protein n=1 Tax=Sphingomonas sp. CROZ-RG-20F-R02-07 TaxID=2914832 RepID=UPI001F576D3B|nr:hypothetical protein [Sphingomonas sp. CROZ-RG-20F-R02-07]
MIKNLNELVSIVISPLTKEDDAVAGFRVLHQNAAQHGGLGNMLGRSHDLLSVLAERDQRIESLTAQAEATRLAMARAERSRKAVVAEQESKERDISGRISDVVNALITGASMEQQKPALSSDMLPKRATARSKIAAQRSSRPRSRAISKPRGAETDKIVFDLLTNKWKCIGTLFREAERSGFRGSEGAIRFAAERAARAGNAHEGRDRLGRIAYRRAI